MIVVSPKAITVQKILRCGGGVPLIVDMEYVKLNTNESPFEPSPKVIKAVSCEEVKKLNLYPDPTGKALIRKLAETYEVEEENVFISNGSDDILNFSFMAFCDKDKGAAFPEISYGFYPVYAGYYNIPMDLVPLKDDWSLDVDKMLENAKREYKTLRMEITTEDTMGSICRRLGEKVTELGDQNIYDVIIQGKRHASLEIMEEKIKSVGNIRAISDQTDKYYDYEQLVKEYEGYLLQRYISSFGQIEEEIDKKALAYGTEAILEALKA